MSTPESLTSTEPFKSGSVRALVTVALLATYILGQLMSAAFSLAVGGVAPLEEDAVMLTPVQALAALLAVLHFAVFVACAVAFCFWIHRAYRNLHALGNPRSSLEHSPGWAVGFFFIPFVNLVMPYRVVKEIWAKSDPRVRTTDDFMYAPPDSTALVLVWWLAWIISNVIDRIALRLSSDAADAATLAWTANVELVASLLGIIAAALAILVVRGIDRRQEERSKHVVYTAAAPPPPPVFTQPPPPPAFAPPAGRADS